MTSPVIISATAKHTATVSHFLSSFGYDAFLLLFGYTLYLALPILIDRKWIISVSRGSSGSRSRPTTRIMRRLSPSLLRRFPRFRFVESNDSYLVPLFPLFFRIGYMYVLLFLYIYIYIYIYICIYIYIYNTICTATACCTMNIIKFHQQETLSFASRSIFRLVLTESASLFAPTTRLNVLTFLTTLHVSFPSFLLHSERNRYTICPNSLLRCICVLVDIFPWIGWYWVSFHHQRITVSRYDRLLVLDFVTPTIIFRHGWASSMGAIRSPHIKVICPTAYVTVLDILWYCYQNCINYQIAIVPPPMNIQARPIVICRSTMPVTLNTGFRMPSWWVWNCNVPRC